MKTEADKKAEKEANYKKYEPKEKSNFHENNRNFTSYQDKTWLEKVRQLYRRSISQAVSPFLSLTGLFS